MQIHCCVPPPLPQTTAVQPTRSAAAYLYVLYVSRGGFYKSADGNGGGGGGVLWRSH